MRFYSGVIALVWAQSLFSSTDAAVVEVLPSGGVMSDAEMQAKLESMANPEKKRKRRKKKKKKKKSNNEKQPKPQTQHNLEMNMADASAGDVMGAQTRSALGIKSEDAVKSVTPAVVLAALNQPATAGAVLSLPAIGGKPVPLPAGLLTLGMVLGSAKRDAEAIALFAR